MPWKWTPGVNFIDACWKSDKKDFFKITTFALDVKLFSFKRCYFFGAEAVAFHFYPWNYQENRKKSVESWTFKMHAAKLNGRGWFYRCALREWQKVLFLNHDVCAWHWALSCSNDVIFLEQRLLHSICNPKIIRRVGKNLFNLRLSRCYCKIKHWGLILLMGIERVTKILFIDCDVCFILMLDIKPFFVWKRVFWSRACHVPFLTLK